MDILGTVNRQLAVLADLSQCECYLSRNAILSMVEWFKKARTAIAKPPRINFKEDASYWASEFFFDVVLAPDFISKAIQELDRPFLPTGWFARRRLDFRPKAEWFIFGSFLFLIDLMRHPPEREMTLCDIVENGFIKRAADKRFVCTQTFEMMPFKTILVLKLLSTLEFNFANRRKAAYNDSLFDGKVCREYRAFFYQLYEDLSFLLSKHHNQRFVEGLVHLFEYKGDDMQLFRTSFHGLLITTTMQLWDLARSAPRPQQAVEMLDAIVNEFSPLIGQIQHHLQHLTENNELGDSSSDTHDTTALDKMLTVFVNANRNVEKIRHVFGP